jgi:hypothetical protein
MKFEDLPIDLRDTEYRDDWCRDVWRKGTIADLLEIWNIDDPTENCAMAQVLRHLRRLMQAG